MWKQMERYVFFPVLFFLLAGLCACQKEKEVIKEKEPDFVYPAEEVTAFGLGADGCLYVCEADERICGYDKTGVQIKEVSAEPGKYECLCVADGKLYAAVSRTVMESGYEIESSLLVEISLADGSVRSLYENALPSTITGMELVNGSLYFLELAPYSEAEAAALNDPEGGYLYYGERLMKLDPVAGEAEEITVERLKGFCKRDEEGLWLYAYDIDMAEFYFTEYNVKGGTFGERHHEGQTVDNYIRNLAYDNTYGKLLYVNGFKAAVLAVEPENAGNQASVFGTTALLKNWSALQYQDGYTYFLSDGKVTRIRNSNYIRENAPLKIYSTSFYDLPEGTGFNLNLEHVDEETMAMALMAGDSDYDMLVLSTAEPLARQIRRTGAYEPLNKVEGVAEYLDTGFDYIKEAATAENGAVWMLPYEVDSTVLLYHPEVCARYGTELESGYTYEKLIQLNRALEAAEETNPAYYELNSYRLLDVALEQYLVDYAVVNGSAQFDTELFRRYSMLIKEEYGRERGSSRYSQIVPGNMISMIGRPDEQIAADYAEYYSSVAVAMADKRFLSRKHGLIGGSTFGIFQYDFFRVKPLPSLEEEKPQKSIAEAVFLVLNPKSEHLEEAKEYLSVLAERLGQEESIYRTKELSGTYNALEQSVHALYGDARIVFSYPDDVFRAEYAKYLRGEKTLDEVIPELERKLDTYLKE